MPTYDANEILNGPFNPKVHAEVFVNYLEVVISPDGVVEYATPSHMQKLLSVYNGYHVPIGDEIAWKDIPDDAAPLKWLMEKTGWICVWSDRYECSGTPTLEQADALNDLRHEGVYQGSVPVLVDIAYSVVPYDDCELEVARQTIDATCLLDATPADELPDADDIENIERLAVLADEHGMLRLHLHDWPGPYSAYLGNVYDDYLRTRQTSKDDETLLRDQLKLIDADLSRLYSERADIDRARAELGELRRQLECKLNH